MTLVPDFTLGRRYRLIDRIATGGMGEVWRAQDELLGRPVAVKVLKSEYVDSPDFLERFRAEARHTAALSHPGIANVYDYGEVGDADTGGTATAYLVMELVDGEPLSTLLARQGRFDPTRTMDVVAQTAFALQAAHDASMVHRDVKPGNLLVRPDGVVKVTDFGIARAGHGVPLTQTGTVLGTAYYASPEQGAGQTVTAVSDIYSLGVVAYECLAGHRPFAGDNPIAVAMAHQRREPPPLDDVPAAVTALVFRALAKRPADRFASAGDLGRAALGLRDALAGGDAARTALLPPLPVDPPTAATRTLTAAGPPVTAGTSSRPATAGTPGSAGTLGSAAPEAPAAGGQPAEPAGWRRRRPSPWLLLPLLLLIGAGALLLRNTGAGGSVAVPDAAGRTETDARGVLRDAGLAAATREVDGGTRPAGVVVDTTPAAGTEVRRDSTVTLNVARGSDRVTVDPADYVGRSYEDARARLAALGFTVRRAGTSAAGRVGTVADVQPTGALLRGSTVTLTVYAAPAVSPSPSPVPSPSPSASPPSAAPSPTSAAPTPRSPTAPTGTGTAPTAAPTGRPAVPSLPGPPTGGTE